MPSASERHYGQQLPESWSCLLPAAPTHAPHSICICIIYGLGATTKAMATAMATAARVVHGVVCCVAPHA